MKLKTSLFCFASALFAGLTLWLSNSEPSMAETLLPAMLSAMLLARAGQIAQPRHTTRPIALDADIERR